MPKRAAALLAALVWALAPSPSAGAEPRLSRPLVAPNGSHLLVTLALEDGFGAPVRERIQSGLATTFDYEIELRRDRKRWFDARVAAAGLQVTAMYNALTREYLVNFKLDGRLIESRSVRDEAALEAAMTRIARLPAFPLQIVPRGVRVLVRARALLGEGTWLGVIPSRDGTGWRESGKLRVPAPAAATSG
jgi:hypothetical protein